MIGPYYVTSNSKRLAAWGKAKRIGYSARVIVDGRRLMVNPLAKVSFQIWEQIRLKHSYSMPGTDTGIWSYRHMRHDSSLPLSVHSWAMAMDANWLQNPAGSKLVTDMPAAMINELLGVRTKSDARLFRWGADWDWDGDTTDHSYVDAMHWEVVAHPLDLATGFTIETQEDTMIIKVGMNGNYIKPYQRALNDARLINNFEGEPIKDDGWYGQNSANLCKRYQAAAGLSVTGELDDLTRDLLDTYIPRKELKV